MATQADLDALAALVRSERAGRRRLTIEQAAEAGDMSPVTWTKVEKGLPVRAATYGVVEDVLGWMPGSIDAYLKDRTGPVRTTDSARAADVPRYIQRILDDPELSDQDKLEIVQHLQAEHEREDEELAQQREKHAKVVVATWKRVRASADNAASP